MTLPRRQSDGAFHGLQIAAQSPIPLRGKPFRSMLAASIKGSSFRQGGFLNGTVFHQHVDYPSLTDQGSAIPDVLIADQWLVVGVGHPNVAVGLQLQRLVRQCLGGNLLCLKLPVPRHGNLVVLTEGTAQIAAEAAHRQYHTAGAEPPQWLLFDGVQDQAVQLRHSYWCEARVPGTSGNCVLYNFPGHVLRSRSGCSDATPKLTMGVEGDEGLQGQPGQFDPGILGYFFLCQTGVLQFCALCIEPAALVSVACRSNSGPSGAKP